MIGSGPGQWLVPKLVKAEAVLVVLTHTAGTSFVTAHPIVAAGEDHGRLAGHAPDTHRTLPVDNIQAPGPPPATAGPHKAQSKYH